MALLVGVSYGCLMLGQYLLNSMGSSHVAQINFWLTQLSIIPHKFSELKFLW